MFEGLYFDGRKHQTLTQEMKDSKVYQRTLLEEHYVLVHEPNSTYLGHVSPSSGSSRVICNEIVTFFIEKYVPFHNLTVIGCDGTNVNTGTNGGVIRLLELELGRPLL